MTTAFATPIISGIACNRLEQPVNTIIEQSSLVHSKSALNSVLNPTEGKGIIQKAKSFVSKTAQAIEDKSFEPYSPSIILYEESREKLLVLSSLSPLFNISFGNPTLPVLNNVLFLNLNRFGV